MKLKTEKSTYPHFAIIEQAVIFGIFFRGVSELLQDVPGSIKYCRFYY